MSDTERIPTQLTFQFPAPGERTNKSAIPVPDDDLATLLLQAARDYWASECDIPRCDGCHNARRVWWDAYLSLPRERRLSITATLGFQGVEFPPIVDSEAR